jgi:UPF0716 family protein affecting phage T7 exclusion
MRTLGAVVLALLAFFFGGCALTAVIAAVMGVWWFLVVALIAVGLFFACMAGIKALSGPPDSEAVPPQEGEKPDQEQ